MNWEKLKEKLLGTDMYHWDGWLFWIAFGGSFFVLIYIMTHFKPFF